MTFGFYLAAGLMLAMVAAVFLLAIWRRQATAEPAAAVDMRLYRDQLREIDRDAARGVMAPTEVESLRAEIARRLLEADRTLSAGKTTPTDLGPPRGFLAALVVLVIAVGSGGLYVVLGAPGYGDLPLGVRIETADARHATRPDQATAVSEAIAAGVLPAAQMPDPRHGELLAQLRAALAQRPDDLAGWELLARNEAGLGNFTEAARAQAEVIRILGAGVRPVDLAVQVEFLVAGAGGYVSPEAEVLLRRLLTGAPSDGPGRFYLGLMHMQSGRYDLAFRLWDRLLREGPPNAPWIGPIRAQMEDLAYLAGQHRYTLPALPASTDAPLRGPSAADIAAAAEMSAEDRMGMVRTMVAGLADRLATEGGPAEDWARLIRAYGVLAETDAARTIAAEAEQVFADQPGDLAMIRAAARDAGATP